MNQRIDIAAETPEACAATVALDETIGFDEKLR
jgi:hypothetical protein